MLQSCPHAADEDKGLPKAEFLDDKIKQFLTLLPGRTSESQNIVTQPLGENLDITGELHGLFLSLTIDSAWSRAYYLDRLAWFILCSSCCRLAVAPVAMARES